MWQNLCKSSGNNCTGWYRNTYCNCWLCIFLEQWSHHSIHQDILLGNIHRDSYQSLWYCHFFSICCNSDSKSGKSFGHQRKSLRNRNCNISCPQDPAHCNGTVLHREEIPSTPALYTTPSLSSTTNYYVENTTTTTGATLNSQPTTFSVTPTDLIQLLLPR